MQFNEKLELSKIRLNRSFECITAAEALLKAENPNSAANRLYYAVFHAMRAVLAFDEIDMKHHSGVISEFRRLYIKTEIFDKKLSEIISLLFDIRTECDYDDFFVMTLEEAEMHLNNAKFFINSIERYISDLQ